MDTVQSTEIENLNNPQEIDNQETTLTEEKEQISKQLPPTDGSSTQGELTDTTGENQETLELDTPVEEVKTPEQIADEEAKKQFEANLRAERAKLASLEAKNYTYELASKIQDEIQEDPEKAILKLIGDRKTFERVIPLVGKRYPQMNLSYDDFVAKAKSHLNESAREDPKALETYTKIEKASQQAVFEAKQQEQETFTQVKYDIMLDMPEFLAKARNPQTAQNAESDLIEALNLAGARINKAIREGQPEPDGIELTKEYLRLLNPEWGTTKIASTVSKQQAKADVKGILKDSVSSTSSTVSSQTTQLTPDQSSKRESFISFLVNDCGNSKEEAIIKANSTTF